MYARHRTRLIAPAMLFEIKNSVLRLKLNISPCPNDTFMFDALVNGRIDTRGYEFEISFADIEELNRRVTGCGTQTAAAPDICKISYAVLPAACEDYSLLDSGSALGYGNGPVLVAREEITASRLRSLISPLSEARRHNADTRAFSVAVPGIHTTANLLLQKLFPTLVNRRQMLFSEIAPAVARGDFDAGILIHEGRFTWRDHGLELVADLGEEWATVTGGLPLPLGAIVASRTLPPKIVRDVEELIRASIEYAFANPAASRKFIKKHAKEMNDSVIDNHIALFVNENSLSLGPEARRAIHTLTQVTF